MPDLKMLNPTKYLYKLTLVKCSYMRSITMRRRKYGQGYKCSSL